MPTGVKRWWRPILVLGGLWTFAAYTNGSVYLADRADERAAQEAEADARAAAPKDFDEARRWLVVNGYTPKDTVTVMSHWSFPDPARGSPVVSGVRKVREGNWLLDPCWLVVMFRFSHDGKFHDVHSSACGTPPGSLFASR